MENTPQVPEPPQQSSNQKNANYTVMVIVFAFCCFLLYNFLTKQPKEPKSEEIAMVDSIKIAKERAKEDSIAKIKEAENIAIVKKLKKNFRTENDEFEECSWISHKTTTKFTDENSIHLYFEQSKSGHPSNLRFRVQYEGDNWLFIQTMTFNIDGENITFCPKDMERDCGKGGRIWEWCDEPASKNTLLVSKISNAKNVKIKMEGRQYYNTRKMSNTQIKAFKETLQYYLALGGKM